MGETILSKYHDLREDLSKNYNKIYIIDNYDFHRSTPYTIFYINKKESFDKFKDLWTKNVLECREQDFDYDDILWRFERDMEDFDYVELGTLDIYTDKDYELEI